MKTAWLFGFNVVFVVAIISQAASLKCLQCHSMHQSLCEEGHIAPKECLDNKNATHCLKMEAKIQMGKFVMRSCSSNRTKAKECGPDIIYGEHAIVCMFACQSDGCNTASGPHQNSFLFTMPFIITQILFLFLCPLL